MSGSSNGSNRLKAASEDVEVEIVTRPTFRWWLSISETLQPDHQVPRPLQDNLWVLKLVEEDKRPAPRGLPFGAEQPVKKFWGTQHRQNKLTPKIRPRKLIF